MRRSLTYGIAATLALTMVQDLATGESAAPLAVRARWLMGTVLEVRLPASPDADALADAAFSAVEEAERAVSTWRDDTELSRLHGEAGTLAREVSEPLAQALDAAVRLRDETGGAFDPALGALAAAYDLRGPGRWPSPDERARALSLAGARALRWDGASRRLTLADPAVRLDLDGIAKGVALDRAAERLRREGVRKALLNFGGQLLAIGPPAGEPPFEALVSSPDGDHHPLLAVPLRDGSLSTSSDSERRRLVDGRPAGHLLDPRTGLFAPYRGSVTVLARTGVEADALSTAGFVLGPEAFARETGRRRARGIAVAYLLPASEGHRALADPIFRPVPASAERPRSDERQEIR